MHIKLEIEIRNEKKKRGDIHSFTIWNSNIVKIFGL